MVLCKRTNGRWFSAHKNVFDGAIALIEFANVSKVYANGTRALRDVNLNIAKGEFVFIVEMCIRDSYYTRARAS